MNIKEWKDANEEKVKDEEKGKLMEMEQGITPLGMVGGSKISGEVPPLECVLNWYFDYLFYYLFYIDIEASMA
ncbi:hypothetical protein VNO80_01186 [Phaseolus coccineus]|uniref:Uncharacterized protein n=1 Tax=Phaseolus coccineus TaxID=3886 RepID=A0AAN9NZK2_PHACN